MMDLNMCNLYIAFLFSYVLLWQTSVDAKLICPVIIQGQGYTVTAEWYSSSTYNDLVSGKLYLDNTLGAICWAHNLTCYLKGQLVSYPGSLSIKIQSLGKDYQITASTFVNGLAGNFTLVWGLRYGQYVESCFLNQGNGINECEQSTNFCLSNSTCTDLPVGYNCTCMKGYSGYACDHSNSSFCSSSPSKLNMWENLTSSEMLLTCQDVNVSSNFTLVQFPNAIFRINVNKINETDVLLHFDLLKYTPDVYNFILEIDNNYNQLVTIMVYNPPRFLSPPSMVTIMENVTSWSVNMTAVTDNVPSVLTYFVVGQIPLGYNFSIDSTGLITVAAPRPNSIIDSFNITVKVLDEMTNLSDIWTVQVTVQDVNESPVCKVLFSVTSVYLSTTSTLLAQINCTDLDRKDEFRQLNYRVSSVPPTVNVSVDKYGNVSLIDKLPVNVTSFDVSVTAQDVDYVVNSNFSVRVINDVPACLLSTSVILLWESKPNDIINLTCKTVDAANIHSINYTGFNVSVQDLFNVSLISENNETVLFNISMIKPVAVYGTDIQALKMQLHLSVNGFKVDLDVIISIFRPPEFSSHYISVSILQNVTTGTLILNTTVTANNTRSKLNYSFTNSTIAYYFNVTERGSIQVIRPIPNNLLNEFNLTLMVTDQITNLSDTAVIQISITDVNESPLCDIISAKRVIYTLDSMILLAHVECRNPDRTEDFTKLNYSVYAVPSSVNVTIDQSGDVMLMEKVSNNLTSFDVFVTVQNMEFVLSSNFRVSIINDVPSCSVSTSVLLLWESNPFGVINVTCETIDPGNVHDIKYTRFNTVPQNLFNVSIISLNNKTVLLNVTMMKYSSSAVNMTLVLNVNKVPVETSFTVLFFNPPKFLNYYWKVDVMQNLKTGTAIMNISATTDNSKSVLNYSLTDIPGGGSPSLYFTTDEKGSIKILQPIPNELIGTFNLTIWVKDTLTNLSDSATIEITIIDVNESPHCIVLLTVTSVYRTVSDTALAQIKCTDDDKNPEFTELNYTVNSVPSSVNVSIDKSGTVLLKDKVPFNLTSFNISVAVQNIEFVVHSNFSVNVINDVPSCTVSKTVLVLWESNQSDVIYVACETVDPGNVLSINYSGFNVIPQDLFNVSMVSNSKTLVFNVTLWKYSSAVANMTLKLTVNNIQVKLNIRIILSDPPKFPKHYLTTNVTQNVATGITIINMSATTNNSQSVLKYSLYFNSFDGLSSHYFTVDETGSVKALQTLSNEIIGILNFTLQVKDTLTNLTDSAVIEVNIIDVNEVPVCVLLNNVTTVYTSMSRKTLAQVTCSDPDKNPEFTVLNYTVYTVPSTVNVSINQSGSVLLVDKILVNLTSFDVFVKVQNIEFTVYYNFSVRVKNDIPSCKVDKPVLLLWESNPSDILNVTCDTYDPGNIHSINYTEFSIIPQRFLNISVISNNNKTILFNIIMRTYSPAITNMTLYLYVNEVELKANISILIFNPPKFAMKYLKTNVTQNITAGTMLINMSATTDNSQSVLNYSLKNIPNEGSPSLYFTIDEKGLIKIIQPFPNDLIGIFNLIIQVKDTLTNLTDTAAIEVNITDVNESPECIVLFNLTSVYTTNSNITLVQINCTDPDKNLEYTKLNYKVFADPPSVRVLINQTGIVTLLNKITSNITSFYVQVTIQDTEFVKYFDFTFAVINDSPYCSVSSNSLVLWKTNTRHLVNVQCVTHNASNNVTYYGSDVTCPNVIRVTSLGMIGTPLILNITLIQYSPSTCNVTVHVAVNEQLIAQNITVLVYNPPVLIPVITHILQNINNGSQIQNVSATTDHPTAIHYYILKSSVSERYFKIDVDGTLIITSVIPNSLVGNISLTILANDTRTGLSSTEIFTIVIEDINEPPNCSISDSMPISSSVNPIFYLAHVVCSDDDRTPIFTNLTYSVITDIPNLINVSEDGKLFLISKIPADLKSINVTVYVSDFSYNITVSYSQVITDSYCPQQTEQGISFKNTLAGTNITVDCPKNYTGSISRSCRLDLKWGNFSFIKCIRKELKDVQDMTSGLLANQANRTTTELNQEILNIASNLSITFESNKPSYSGDILQTINVLGDITKVVQQNNLSADDTTLMKFVSISNYLLLADGKPWSELASKEQNAPSTFIYVMDVLVTSTLSSVNNDSQIVKDTIAIVRGVSSGGITFPKSHLQEDKEDWTQISGNKIFLPKEAFPDSVKYSIITYKDALEKFQISQNTQNVSNELKNFSFASEILTLSVLSDETLKKDLKLQFQIKNVLDAKVPNCGFLDTSVSKIGQWSTKGCTVEFFQNNTVNCSCNHLTNFAILMSPSQVEAQSMVLSIISTIGCAISIFCLIVTIIVYLIVWRHVKGDRSVLHVNLCLCLIICYILFLAGVDRTENQVGCKIVAVLLHYFYLTVFFTMLSEGIQIFRSVVFVFRRESMIRILLPFIYGVPMIIVAVSLGVTQTEGYVSDNYCWLSVKKGIIWAFVGPVLLVLLSNFIILMIVLRVIQSTAVHRLKSKSERLRSVVWTIFMLSPILGLTWVFGVLSVNSDLVVFQYLFAILNSLQGFFVFLLYCILAHQIRDGISNLRKSRQLTSFDTSHKMTESSSKPTFETKTSPRNSSSSEPDYFKPVSRSYLTFMNQTYGTND